MEKVVMCAVMLIAVAEVKFSSTAAVAPELRNLGLRQQTSTTAALATKDPNLLYVFTAVAKGRLLLL